MKKTKIYLGQASTGTVVDFQAYMLRDLAKTYGEQIELVYPESCAHRIFHDAARNGIVEDFLESDCDILWFLDSDVIPPPNVLDLVTLHGDKWECAGAPYPIFISPSGDKTGGRQVLFTVYKELKGPGNGLYPCDIPSDGVEFVDGIATGCLFIKREVFAKLERPWFKFTYDPITRGPTVGEDLDFCFRCKTLGIPFLTDYSMLCKHYKNVDLLEVNNYALLYAQKSLKAYEGQIKAELRASLQAAKQRQSQQQGGLILPEHLRA